MAAGVGRAQSATEARMTNPPWNRVNRVVRLEEMRVFSGRIGSAIDTRSTDLAGATGRSDLRGGGSVQIT